MPFTEDKVDRVIDLTLTEVNRASKIFVEDLDSFDWFGFLRHLLFTDDDATGRDVDALSNIVQNFGGRLALSPARALGGVVIEATDFGDFRSHVVRTDVALAFTLRELLDIGTDVALLNIPERIGLAKRVKSFWDRWVAIRFLDANAFFRVIKGRLFNLIVLIARIVWALVATLATVIIIGMMISRYRASSERRRILGITLSQDSRRVRRRLPGIRQVRINARPGPDR